LDAGVEALKKVKAELKRYRQAVLKYAFEGKLTAEWREKNKDKLEPASKLLERIAKERQNQAKGRKQKKLPPLDKSTLPELPEGWEWATAGAVCNIQTGKKDANQGDPSGKYPFFTCAASPIRSPVYSFEGEAILLPGNGANVGLALFYNGKFEAYQRTYVLNGFEVNARFLFYFFKGFWEQNLGKQYGSATNYIRLGNIVNFVLPISPLTEQQQIVAEIERHFSIADEVEQAVEKALKQAERLRQSILKKAFEGKLTEKWRRENPELITGENSAEKLLERIKAEKARLQAQRKPRTNKTRKSRKAR